MAEEEGVAGATWEEFKAHPYIIAGAVGAVVILLWYASRAKPGAQPQQFAFSYGPSDAQVAAGTKLAIAQHADQTALSMATLQSTDNQKAEGDYFSYLTGANNNSLLATLDSNASQVSINATNNANAFATNLTNNQTKQIATYLNADLQGASGVGFLGGTG